MKRNNFDWNVILQAFQKRILVEWFINVVTWFPGTIQERFETYKFGHLNVAKTLYLKPLYNSNYPTIFQVLTESFFFKQWRFNFSLDGTWCDETEKNLLRSIYTVHCISDESKMTLGYTGENLDDVPFKIDIAKYFFFLQIAFNQLHLVCKIFLHTFTIAKSRVTDQFSH